jgi:hypothetical protein
MVWTNVSTEITNEDGGLRLVLERDIYEGGRKVAE